jgi:hypothetical protein
VKAQSKNPRKPGTIQTSRASPQSRRDAKCRREQEEQMQ